MYPLALGKPLATRAVSDVSTEAIRAHLAEVYGVDTDCVKTGAEASDEEAGLYAGEDDSWLVFGTMPNTNEIGWFYAGNTRDFVAEIDGVRSRSTRAVATRAVDSVTVIAPRPCRMRAVICRDVRERAIVEYTGSETDDRYAILDAILPQIPDDAWTRQENYGFTYVDSLECCDGDEMGDGDPALAGMAGRGRSRSIAARAAMTNAEKVVVLESIVEYLQSAVDLAASIDSLIDKTVLQQLPATLASAQEALAYLQWLVSDDRNSDVLDADMKAGRSRRSRALAVRGALITTAFDDVDGAPADLSATLDDLAARKDAASAKGADPAEIEAIGTEARAAVQRASPMITALRAERKAMDDAYASYDDALHGIYDGIDRITEWAGLAGQYGSDNAAL